MDRILHRIYIKEKSFRLERKIVFFTRHCDVRGTNHSAPGTFLLDISVFIKPYITSSGFSVPTSEIPLRIVFMRCHYAGTISEVK